MNSYQNNCWKAPTTLRACPLVQNDGNNQILVSETVKSKVLRLEEKFRNEEWMGYLKGSRQGNVLSVVDMVIPKQVVSSVAVTPIDFPFVDGIIGTIHSHHGMGAFLSTQDTDHLADNHDLTIVVSRGQFESTVRKIAPCGSPVQLKVPLDFTLPITRVTIMDRLVDSLARFLTSIFPVRTKDIEEIEDPFELEISNIMTPSKYNEYYPGSKEPKSFLSKVFTSYLDRFP